MSGGRAVVLIDGGYLDHVLKSCGVRGDVDYDQLIHALARPAILKEAFYYHCRHYRPKNPTPEDRKRQAASDSFFDRLERVPLLTVRYGKLVRRGETPDGQPILVQKQVDVLLAVEIVRIALRHEASEIVLLTGDSDLLPALRIARDEGIRIRLAHGTRDNRPHGELRELAHESHSLDRDWFYAHCLRPLR